jgi:hypothetical protein
VREEKPADDAADDVACRKGDVDIEGLQFAKPSGFEKDDRVTEDGIAAEGLSRPDDAILVDWLATKAIFVLMSNLQFPFAAGSSP